MKQKVHWSSSLFCNAHARILLHMAGWKEGWMDGQMMHNVIQAEATNNEWHES